MTTQLGEGFFAGTRGQVVTVLRRDGRTVQELAEALLTEVVGVPVGVAVRELCDRRERPLCCFEVVLDESVGCDPGR